MSDKDDTPPVYDGWAMQFAGKTIRRPPASARCGQCGKAQVSPLPTHAVGSGVASRPIADDVFCSYCGHVGPPVYQLPPKTR